MKEIRRDGQLCNDLFVGLKHQIAVSKETKHRKEKIEKVVRDNPYSSTIDKEELEDIEKAERKENESGEVEF